MQETYLTVAEAAKILNSTEIAVRARCRRGRFKTAIKRGEKFRGDWYVARKEIEALRRGN